MRQTQGAREAVGAWLGAVGATDESPARDEANRGRKSGRATQQ